MPKIRFSKSVSASALLLGALSNAYGSKVLAQQTTDFSLTQSYITGCTAASCPGPFGTVVVTQMGSNEVGISLSLPNGEVFANTGSGVPLMFNIAGDPTLSSSNFSYLTPGFLFEATPGAAPGTGAWDYGFACTGCGNGTSRPNLSSISFDLTLSSGISAKSFVANNKGNVFGSDIYFNGNTGPVTSTGGVMAAPEIDPSSAASGIALLVGGLLVLRGRKQPLVAA